MATPAASIVIPSYQHGAFVADAVRSALAQTVPIEVIVVDDGSTDDTLAVLAALADPRLRVLSLPHRGPSAARNAGLDAARGEFVMLLDADDVIAPTKIATQLAEFAAAPHAGWVLCDVLIVDEGKTRTETASDRYNYAARELDGWIDGMLAQANFIPIMAPLVRREVITDIRFMDTSDGTPEDWGFWQRVARVARVRYVPEVLATYRKRTTGRNRLPKAARAVSPNLEAPLRLNLGCGTQGTRSWHPIAGFVNLDKSMGWRFEDGLSAFGDGTVAGITISHALMYVAERDWPAVFREFARVLAPGGVVRITEDDAINPTSRRYGGWKGSESAVTLTSAALVREHLERAGLVAHEVDREATRYPDGSLRQAQHGAPPDVFFIEGVRVAGVLFAPHNDDETLFAAFTILRHRPRVVVCYGSAGDYGDSATREAETREAMAVLGAAGVEQWQGGDLVRRMREFDAVVKPERVWAPASRTSHPDHVAVAIAAATVFGARLTSYHTYVDGQKVRSDRPVPFEREWVPQKMRALLRYTSQLSHPRAYQFFTHDLLEYYGGPVDGTHICALP